MARESSRAWFIVPAVVLFLIGMTVISLRTGKTLSEPFAGGKDAQIVLRAPSGGGVTAADQLLVRLSLLGVRARVVKADEASVQLRVMRVDAPGEVVSAVADPEAVQVRPILDARDHLPPDAPELKRPVAPGTEKLPIPWATAPTRSELEALVAQRGLPAGTASAIECVEAPKGAEGGMCAAWLLGPERFDGTQIRTARISSHRLTEEPLVTFEVDVPGAQALQVLTRNNVGRQAAIIALGEIRARPLISEASQGEAWTFSTRTGDTNRRQAVERAERIAAAAELPALPPLIVEKVEIEQ